MLFTCRRSTKRVRGKSGVALTPKGVCKITNLSKSGVSLKSFQRLELPPEWTMDIYDEIGLFVNQINVKKIWTRQVTEKDKSLFSVEEFGGKFENLAPCQKKQLEALLQKNDEPEFCF